MSRNLRNLDRIWGRTFRLKDEARLAEFISDLCLEVAS
jgi:hypothetical protein